MKEMWFDVQLVLAALDGDEKSRERLRIQARCALHAPEGSRFLVEVGGDPSVGIPGDLVDVRTQQRWHEAKDRRWFKEQLAECFRDTYGMLACGDTPMSHDGPFVTVRDEDEIRAELAAEEAEAKEDHEHTLARERGANTSYDERDE